MKTDTVKILSTEVGVDGLTRTVTQKIEMRDPEGNLHNDGVTVVTVFAADDTGEGYAPDIDHFHFVCQGPDGVHERFERPSWAHFEDICSFDGITRCARDAAFP